MGTFDPRHQVNLQNGRFAGTTAGQMRSVFEALGQPEHADQPIVLHFHGGLVSESVGLSTARRLQPVYEDAGAYPLFFVWESGFLEVVGRNLPEIVEDVLFKRLFGLVAGAVARAAKPAGADGTRGLSPVAAASLDELAELDQDPEAGRRLGESDVAEEGSLSGQFLHQAVFADQVVSSELERLLDEAEGSELADTPATAPVRPPEDEETERGLLPLRLAKGAVVVLYQIGRRFKEGRGHGLVATVVEELLREFYLGAVGQAVWRAMKQDTADAFEGDADVAAGRCLVECLTRELATRPHRRVVAVGHSTGAVYIGELLRRCGGLPGATGIEAVFLAPACTYEHLAVSLDAAPGRLHRLRVFGMCDERERADVLVPGVPFYPHSLLYFVSGVCEPEADTPLVGLQRHYEHPIGDQEHHRRVLALLDQTGNGCVWSPATGPAGRRSNSSRHVDFDDDATTLASVQQLARGGW